MAGQNAPKTPYSARPSALESPVPTPEAAPLAPKIPPMPAGSPAPRGTPAPAPSEMEAAFAQWEANGGDANAHVAEQFQNDPEGVAGFVDANLTPAGISQQISELGVRARESFAKTDKETRQVLEEKFGKDNVTKREDSFWVKRPGAKKFTKFDRDTVELLADLADGARAATEEAVALPYEIAGAMKGAGAGGAAGAPVAGVGAIPGAAAGGAIGVAAGRAIGAGMATNVADEIAQNLLGIERDPERSRLLETGLASSLSAVFGFFGDKLGKVAARKLAAKKLAVPEHEAISNASKELLEETRQLRDLGKIEVGPGGKVTLLPHQVDPTNGKAVAWAKEVSSLPQFGKLVKDQAEAADKLITDTLSEAASLSGKGPLSMESIAKQVTNVVSELRTAEGKAIGEFRRKAGAKLGDTAKTLPSEALTTLYELNGRMGFDPKMLRAAQPTREVLDGIMGSMGIASEGEARFFFKQMQQVSERMSRGVGMTFDNLAESIAILDKGNKQARRAGGEISALYNRLSSELRAARNELVEKNIPASEVPAFKKSMQRFQDVMNTTDNLGSTLSEDIASHAFIADVFSNGKAGLPKLQAVKNLLEESHPEVWDGLKANFIEQLVSKNTKESADFAGKIDAAGVKKQVLSLGKEARDILFDGDPTAIKQFFTALDYGQRIRDTNFARLSPDSQAKIAEGFLSSLAGGAWAKAKTAMQLIGAAEGKDSKFMEMLTDQGVDKFFGKMPAGERAVIRETFSKMQDLYRESMIRGTAPTAIAPVRRAARTELRSQAIESQYEKEPNARVAEPPGGF